MSVSRSFIPVSMRSRLFVIPCSISSFIKPARSFSAIANPRLTPSLAWLNKPLSFSSLAPPFAAPLITPPTNLSTFLATFSKSNKLFDLSSMLFSLASCGFWPSITNAWLRLLLTTRKPMLVWLLETDTDAACCLENSAACCNPSCCNCFFNISFG